MTATPFTRIRSSSPSKALLSVATFLNCWSLPIAANAAPDLDWRTARNVPYVIIDGLELARNRADKAFASLSLICSSEGETHLLLLTRLPGEDGFRRVRPGRDDHAVLFVGEGISNKLPIIVDVVALSDSNAVDASHRVETIVTPALSPEAMITLSGWFGQSPPTKVSVGGIDETGVFMVGTRDGRAVQDFAETCASPR